MAKHPVDGAPECSTASSSTAASHAYIMNIATQEAIEDSSAVASFPLSLLFVSFVHTKIQ